MKQEMPSPQAVKICKEGSREVFSNPTCSNTIIPDENWLPTLILTLTLNQTLTLNGG